MIVLGLETTGQNSSLALLQDNQPLATASLISNGRPTTEHLLLKLADRFTAVALPESAVELLCVSRGPGSFTGLRVGLVVAKTWAYVRHIPLVGVETFSSTVQPIPFAGKQIEVVEDLRQGYVGWQRFGWQAGPLQWTPLTPAQVERVEQWQQHPRTEVAFTGNGLERLQKQFPDHQFPPDWEILPRECRSPDAVAVARQGVAEYQRRGGDDPFTLLPLYLRRSAAE